MLNSASPSVGVGAVRIYQSGHQNPDHVQALFYVNKIKCRLSPEKYGQFLDILHGYQKQQKRIQESPNSKEDFSEKEACVKIANLLKDQQDLLEELYKYSPTTDECLFLSNHHNEQQSAPSKSTVPVPATGTGGGQSSFAVKPLSPIKKTLEVKMNETELRFKEFDTFLCEGRQTLLPSQYDAILKAFELYSLDVLALPQLAQSADHFLRNEPRLLKWFKNAIHTTASAEESNQHANLPRQSQNVTINESICSNKEELLDVSEIDTSTWRRLDHSYCRIPKKYRLSKCSGMDEEACDVLNHDWISIPVWTGGASYKKKKTRYEDFMCRCEDDRFETDILIQANADILSHLMVIQEKMNGMSEEERWNFRLDNCLGSGSTIHLVPVKRIYGEGAFLIVLEGLKLRPSIVVPLVIKRLKEKDEEWREVRRKCDKFWREQTQRFTTNSNDDEVTDRGFVEGRKK